MAAKKQKAADAAKGEPPADEKGIRPRSPNRPALGLEASIEKANILYEKYNRAQVAISLASSNWGYKNPRSSGLLQLVAALKAFGLIDVFGQGASQKVAVSESGERIIRNAPDRTALLRAVAVSPTIHAEVWDHFDKQLPHDDIIKQYLLWERNVGSRFTDDTVEGFITQFRGTLRFAGLISADGSTTEENNLGSLDTSNNGKGPKVPPAAVRVGSYVQWTSNGQHRFPTPLPVVGITDDGEWAFVEGSQSGLPMSELTVETPPIATPKTPPINPFFSPKGDEPVDGAALERMTLDEGPVKLEWPNELSKESVEEFEYWLTGLIKRAKRKAGVEPKRAKPGPPD